MADIKIPTSTLIDRELEKPIVGEKAIQDTPERSGVFKKRSISSTDRLKTNPEAIKNATKQTTRYIGKFAIRQTGTPQSAIQNITNQLARKKTTTNGFVGKDPAPQGSGSTISDEIAFQNSGNTDKILGFLRNEGTTYFTKDIMLGTQQAHLLRDVVKSIMSVGSIIETKLESIKINTGSPEVAKQTILERFTEGVVSSAVDTLSEKASKLIGTKAKKIYDARIKPKVDDHFERFKKDRAENPDKSLIDNIKTLVSNVRKDVPDLNELRNIFNEEIGIPTKNMAKTAKEFVEGKRTQNSNTVRQNKFRMSNPSVFDTIRQNVPDTESMTTSAISNIKNTWSSRIKPKVKTTVDAAKEYYDMSDIVPKEFINTVISNRGPPRDALSKIRKSSTRMSDSMREKLSRVPDKDAIVAGVTDTVSGIGSRIYKAKKEIRTNPTLTKILERLNVEESVREIPLKIGNILETTKQKIKSDIDETTGGISKKASSIGDTIRARTESVLQNMSPQSILGGIFKKNKDTEDQPTDEEGIATNKIDNPDTQSNALTSHIQKLMSSIERLVGYKTKEERTNKQDGTNNPNIQDNKLQNDTIVELLRSNASVDKEYYDKSLRLLEEIARNTEESTLLSKGKSVFRGIRNAAGAVTSAYGKILGGGLNLGAAIVKSVFSGNAPRFTDVYLKSDPKKPAITAKQLEQGLVTSDGRPIMKMSDIKTSVHDPRTGKILLTEEDLTNGIMGPDGKEIKNQTQFGLIGGGTRIAIAGIKTAGQILTSRNPIFKMYESIFTTTIGAVGSVGKLVGSSVLALVTGKAIPNAIKGGFGLAKSMMDMYKSMFQITTKVIGSMADVAYTAIARLFGFSTKKDDKKFINRDDLEETIGIRLDSIYELLQGHFNTTKSDSVKGDADKDGVRDNSYADYMRTKRAKEEETKHSKKNGPDKKSSGSYGALAAAAAALAGKNKTNGDESSSLLGTIATGAGGYLASKIPGVKGALNAAKSVVFKKPLASAAGVAGIVGISGLSSLIPDDITKTTPDISGIRNPIKTPQSIQTPNIANDIHAPTPNRTVGNTAAKVAEEAAIDIGIKSGSKVAAEEAAKMAAKSAAKKIPILGAIAGGAFSIDRLLDGDFVGAGGELASGLVSLVPAIGTGASLAIDAWLGYRDYERANDPHTKLIIERMNAYGVTDKKLYDYVLSIEKKQSEMMFGNATKLSTADFAKMAVAFGMDSKNINVVEYFAAWYTKRFSRCFLVYLECLGKFGKKYNTSNNLTTTEVETLTKEFVAAVSKFTTKYDPVKPTMDAYNAMVNGTPVPGTNTSSDPAQEPRPFDPTNPAGSNTVNAPSNDNINTPIAPTTAQVANQNIQQIASPQNTSSGAPSGVSSVGSASDQPSPVSGGSSIQPPTTPTPVQSAVAAIENKLPTTPQVPQNAIGAASSAASTATTVAYAVPNLKPPGAPQGGQQPGPQPSPGSSVGSGSSTDRLGALSAKYESGKHGSKAIGWDSTGGTSYGKYQIAAKPGGYSEFLAFAKTQGQYGADVATRLINAGPGETGSTKGAAPDTWRQLATENPTEFGKLEHNYIKKYHYDKVYKRLSPAAKEAVDKSPALQDVLWSTVVQHSGHGKNIFNDQYDPNPEVYIRKIYQNRAGRFGSSEPHVRASVQKRFLDEQVRAIAMLKNDGAVLAELEKAKAQKAMPQTPAPDTAARDSGQGGTTQTADNKAGQPSTVGAASSSGPVGDTVGSSNPNASTQQAVAGDPTSNTSPTGENAPSISLQPQSTESNTQQPQTDQINKPTITAAVSPQTQPENTTPPQIPGAVSTTPQTQAQQQTPINQVNQPIQQVVNAQASPAFKPEVLASAIAQGQSTSAESFAASMARMETTITTVFGSSGPLAEMLSKQSTPQSPIQQAATTPQLQAPANSQPRVDLNIDKSRQPRYTG